jgi:hypothetical protein
MTPETEKQLRLMAKTLTKAVNNHIVNRTDGINEDYLFYHLRIACELGEKNLDNIIEKACLYDKLRGVLRDLAQ